MNFLKETVDCIIKRGYQPEDITFIGSKSGEYYCTWEDFLTLADFEYYCGFGGQEVVGDIVICFTDGTWLSRGEYDGSEWWDYNKVPTKAVDTTRITKFNLQRSCWESSIAELNQKAYEEDIK